jgi:glycine/D-amino acid oxidase-like deaminating enzyme
MGHVVVIGGSISGLACALCLALSSADPTRGALQDPHIFEAAARAFPAMSTWPRAGPCPCLPSCPWAG